MLPIIICFRGHFFEIVKDTTQQQFKVGLDKLLRHLAPPTGNLIDDNIRGLFFGDYMVPGAEPRVYDEITDFVELTSVIEKSVIIILVMISINYTLAIWMSLIK